MRSRKPNPDGRQENGRTGFNEAGSVRSRKQERRCRPWSRADRFNEAGSVRSRKQPETGEVVTERRAAELQ